MKPYITTLLLLGGLSIPALAEKPISATEPSSLSDSQSTEQTTETATASSADPSLIKEKVDALLDTPALTSAPVFNHNDEELGNVDRLVIDPATGQVKQVVVSVGGFLGLGDRLVAVPWDQFEIRKVWNPSEVEPTETTEETTTATSFNKSTESQQEIAEANTEAGEQIADAEQDQTEAISDAREDRVEKVQDATAEVAETATDESVTKEPAEANKEIAEAQQEASKEVTDAKQEESEEIAEANNEKAEEVADAREEQSEKIADAREEKANDLTKSWTTDNDTATHEEKILEVAELRLYLDTDQAWLKSAPEFEEDSTFATEDNTDLVESYWTRDRAASTSVETSSEAEIKSTENTTEDPSVEPSEDTAKDATVQ